MGDTYDGQVKRWYSPAGYDLRAYLEQHPEWVDLGVNLEVFHRRLMLYLLYEFEL